MILFIFILSKQPYRKKGVLFDLLHERKKIKSSICLIFEQKFEQRSLSNYCQQKQNVIIYLNQILLNFSSPNKVYLMDSNKETSYLGVEA